MAYPNGRLNTSILAELPTAYSNKGKVERLRADAAEALTRAMLRAVAQSGSNFSVWSAYRDHADQVAMLRKHYRRVSRGRYKSSDRSWDGSTWAKRLGHPTVASPGYSNHGTGIAVDIHPGRIQRWLKNNGRRYGWTWDEGRRVGESWHFVYDPALDEFKGQGIPPVREVQKLVGVKTDGKFGTATARAVKAWQRDHGLTADGIPGPDTLGAMLGGGTGNPAPVGEYTIEHQPTKNRYEGREKDGQTGTLDAIVIHHWGDFGQDFDTVVQWLQADGNGNEDSSAHEVISGTRVAVLAPAEDATWSTGDFDGNLSTYSFELRPEADEATIRTAAARIRALRDATGSGLPLTVHQDYVDTACPGRWLQLLDTLDALAQGGDVPIPATGPLTLPTGKELLVKLTECPDFPLLRTSDHLCYYGDEDKLESVSGKMPNSLVPGEIFGSGSGSGAHGLKAWQAQVGIEPDGRFGSGTDRKVRAVQQRAGLKVDGKLGPSTWYATFILGL